MGANEVHGGISDKWGQLDGENWALGYPISNEHDTDGGDQSDFEKGHITWLAENGESHCFLPINNNNHIFELQNRVENSSHTSEPIN